MVMKAIYENKVLGVGPHAEDFRATNMLILFGATAPPELKDYCYLVNVNPIDGQISVGDILRIDDGFYKITCIGAEAPVTLQSLGHCSIGFTGVTEPNMAGTLYVEQAEVPVLKVGTTIQIIKYE